MRDLLLLQPFDGYSGTQPFEVKVETFTGLGLRTTLIAKAAYFDFSSSGSPPRGGNLIGEILNELRQIQLRQFHAKFYMLQGDLSFQAISGATELEIGKTSGTCLNGAWIEITGGAPNQREPNAITAKVKGAGFVGFKKTTGEQSELYPIELTKQKFLPPDRSWDFFQVFLRPGIEGDINVQYLLPPRMWTRPDPSATWELWDYNNYL